MFNMADAPPFYILRNNLGPRLEAEKRHGLINQTSKGLNHHSLGNKKE